MIGPAVEVLKNMIKTIKQLHSDGCGVAVSAHDIKTAEVTVELGMQTVGITFCLFHILFKLPKAENKKAAVEQLKKELSDKSLQVPKNMEEKLDSFSA